MRRRLMLRRIAVSRWIARHLLGSDAMLCAEMEWRGHWSRHALNFAFVDRGHCKAAADFEAMKRRELDFIADARREGWL